MENDKTHFILISIVAIVAVVGIVAMIIGVNQDSKIKSVLGQGDVVGQAGSTSLCDSSVSCEGLNCKCYTVGKIGDNTKLLRCTWTAGRMDATINCAPAVE